MRPGDRTLRGELRREAATVPVPDDMWQKISQRLDEHEARKHQKRRAHSEQWRPALVLAVAAGFFWFALIPALPNMRAVLPEGGPRSTLIDATPVSSGVSDAKAKHDPDARNGQPLAVADRNWPVQPQ